MVFPPFVPTAVATHPPFAISVAVSGHAAGSQEEIWGAKLWSGVVLTHGQETVKSVLPFPLSLLRELRENGADPTAANEFAPPVPGFFQIKNASATRKATPRI